MKIFKIPLLYILAVAMSCGIEVGNPADEDEGSNDPKLQEGQLSVEIADAPLDDLSKVYLNIKALSLITLDKELYPLDLLTTDINTVDLLAFQDGQTATLVKEQAVPLTEYLGFLIELDEAKIGWVETTDQVAQSLALPNGKNFIAVIDPTILSESEQSIVLHFELERSITKLKDGSYEIDPLVGSIPKRRAASVRGKINPVVKGHVCAYLEQEPSETEASFFLQNQDGPKKSPAPPPGGFRPPPPDHKKHGARGPHRGGKPKKHDPSSGVCGQGFAKKKIKSDGSFGLDFLKPGTYSIRIFARDGQVYDSDISFEVGPGERKDLGDVAVSPVETSGFH